VIVDIATTKQQQPFHGNFSRTAWTRRYPKRSNSLTHITRCPIKMSAI